MSVHCACGHPGLTYDGPVEDCPTHGLTPAMSDRDRLERWLRQVAVFSNDGWLAREAAREYVELTGSEPQL